MKEKLEGGNTGIETNHNKNEPHKNRLLILF